MDESKKRLVNQLENFKSNSKLDIRDNLSVLKYWIEYTFSSIPEEISNIMHDLEHKMKNEYEDYVYYIDSIIEELKKGENKKENQSARIGCGFKIYTPFKNIEITRDFLIIRHDDGMSNISYFNDEFHNMLNHGIHIQYENQEAIPDRIEEIKNLKQQIDLLQRELVSSKKIIQEHKQKIHDDEGEISDLKARVHIVKSELEIHYSKIIEYLENKINEMKPSEKLTEEEKNKIEFDHHFYRLPNGVLMQKFSAGSPFFDEYWDRYHKLREMCDMIKEFVESHIPLPISPDDLKNKLSYEIFVFVYDKIFRSK